MIIDRIPFFQGFWNSAYKLTVNDFQAVAEVVDHCNLGLNDAKTFFFSECFSKYYCTKCKCFAKLKPREYIRKHTEVNLTKEIFSYFSKGKLKLD